MLTATSISALAGCGQDDEPSVTETDTDTNELLPQRMGNSEDPAAQPDDANPPGGGEANDNNGNNDDADTEFNGGTLPNGLELPANYQSWGVIGVVDPEGPTIRVIVGNRIAVNAARIGDTTPWPDGSMLMHYVWNEEDNPFLTGGKSQGEFQMVTLMVKDSEAYVLDGGWAYGVWTGPNLDPATAKDFDRACVSCHTTEVADNDYVFTRPGLLPTTAAVRLAGPTPSGFAMPGDILDWGVIGVINRAEAEDQSIRVIVGNRAAVGAARSGLDGPWPEGAMLAHYVWAADDNPDIAGAVTPGAFQAITLMEKQGEDYGVDGGWKYGMWTSTQLARPADPAFDRACVDCHTTNVSDQDFVFTVPGAVPFPAP